MKPLVLKAQSKELYDYLKGIQELSLEQLMESHQKLLKMQMEISENMKKMVSTPQSG